MEIAEIKRQFMAMRNGVVADTLRRAGMTAYDVIFGLNIPQLAAIAASLPHDKALAEALWADRKVRESRLLACHLFPPSEVSEAEARALLSGVQTREEADILAFRLLRRLPCLPALAASAPTPYASRALSRYL